MILKEIMAKQGQKEDKKSQDLLIANCYGKAMSDVMESSVHSCPEKTWDMS